MVTANSAAMFRLLIFLVTLSVRGLRATFRTRQELLIEKLASRQQVAALKKQRPRPVLDDVDWDWPRARHTNDVTRRPSGKAKVVALPCVEGLHHRYEWREAG